MTSSGSRVKIASTQVKTLRERKVPRIALAGTDEKLSTPKPRARARPS